MSMLAPFSFSLRQLQYAVAVADELSFRKAAERCNVSQPSLSAQLAQMEGALGIRIFERGRQGVLLTPAGEAFLARARRVLLETGDLVEEVQRVADPFAGRLRIGVIPTIAPYLLPEIVPALRKRYPRLRFLWVEEKTAVLTERLATGAIDAAILALEAEIGDVETTVLGVDEFVLAAAPQHPLAAGKRPVRQAELAGERVLLLDDGHCFREQALAFCGKARAEEEDFRATSLATLVQMAAGSSGVTLLPRLALPVENRRGALRIREFAAKAPHRTVALVWRRQSALETSLRAVGDTLQAEYRHLEKRLARR